MAKRLPTPRQVLLGASLIYVVNSFADWQQLTQHSFTGLAYGGYGQTEWHGLGMLAAVLAVAVLVYEGAGTFLARFEVGSEAPDNLAVALLAIAAGILTVFGFLSDSLDRGWPAWLGLAVSPRAYATGDA